MIMIYVNHVYLCSTEKCVMTSRWRVQAVRWQRQDAGESAALMPIIMVERIAIGASSRSLGEDYEAECEEAESTRCWAGAGEPLLNLGS